MEARDRRSESGRAHGFAVNVGGGSPAMLPASPSRQAAI
jgi:hypothetical protein